MELKALEEKTGYSFKDKALLRTALTHSSYANESNGKTKDNERLEFLGDAVLELIVSDYIFHNNDMPEGQMTKLRASIVCEPTLAGVARDIELGQYLRLGRGEEKCEGRKRPSILSDALEAVLGAIYLDGGMERAKEFVLSFILSNVEERILFYDSKTILQERAQAAHKSLTYQVIDESGPDHNKSFTVDVLLDEKSLGSGSGRSIKAAEQEAAYKILKDGIF